jgi:ABC-type transporter Mla subunit MlaD
VFGALNERGGQLRGLVRSSHDVFQATADEKTALAETFHVFPTFLDESKQTLERLQTFSANTAPLIRDLQPAADDLAPTIQDVAALSPDLESLFRNLPAVIAVGVKDLPDAQRYLRGASPVFDGLRVFLPELNPILSYANFDQTVLAGLFAGAASFNVILGNDNGVPEYALQQFGVINNTSLQLNQTRPSYETANSYPEPNAYTRAQPLGIQESFDCRPSGGEVHQASDHKPPCYVKPPSLYDNSQFPTLQSGKAPNVPSPGASSLAGTRPARP